MCIVCNVEHPRSQFYKQGKRRDGSQRLGKRCKECYAHYQRLRRYQITRGEYEMLLDFQEGQCGICGVTAKLVVDHCHNTGEVRGLLCDDCNLGIGKLKDDPALLLMAYQWVSVEHNEPQRLLREAGD